MTSGAVRVTRQANPAGAAPRGTVLVLAGAGVLAQEQVQQGAGTQPVRAARQPGGLQFPGPGGNPVIRGQNLVRGSSRPARAALPESSAHRSTRADLAAGSRASAAFPGRPPSPRGDRGARPPG